MRFWLQGGRGEGTDSMVGVRRAAVGGRSPPSHVPDDALHARRLGRPLQQHQQQRYKQQQHGVTAAADHISVSGGPATS